jgi:hypothetical protein
MYVKIPFSDPDRGEAVSARKSRFQKKQLAMVCWNVWRLSEGHEGGYRFQTVVSLR